MKCKDHTVETAGAAGPPGCFAAAGPLGPWGSGCMFSSMITTSSSSSDRSTASAAVAPALLLSLADRLDGTAAVATLASLLLGPSALSVGPLHDDSSVQGQCFLHKLVPLDAMTISDSDQPIAYIVAGDRIARLCAMYAIPRLQANMLQTVYSTLLCQKQELSEQVSVAEHLRV